MSIQKSHEALGKNRKRIIQEISESERGLCPIRAIVEKTLMYGTYTRRTRLCTRIRIMFYNLKEYGRGLSSGTVAFV